MHCFYLTFVFFKTLWFNYSASHKSHHTINFYVPCVCCIMWAFYSCQMRSYCLSTYREKKKWFEKSASTCCSLTLNLSKFSTVRCFWVSVLELAEFYTGAGGNLYAKYAKGSNSKGPIYVNDDEPQLNIPPVLQGCFILYYIANCSLRSKNKFDHNFPWKTILSSFFLLLVGWLLNRDASVIPLHLPVWTWLYPTTLL